MQIAIDIEESMPFVINFTILTLLDLVVTGLWNRELPAKRTTTFLLKKIYSFLVLISYSINFLHNNEDGHDNFFFGEAKNLLKTSI